MKKQKGFTLTEIMVAVAIGLISTIVIFKALQSSNMVSSSTTGSSDINTSGQIALYNIERDIRMAGYGLNEPYAVGCRIRYSNANLVGLPSDITNNNAIFAPVSATIINGTDVSDLTNNNNTAFRVAYAGLKYVSNTRLTRNFNGANQPITVANQFGLTEPGMVLLLSGPASSSTTLTPCMTRQVTDFVNPEILIQSNGNAPLNVTPGVAMNDVKNNEYKVFNLGSIASANLSIPGNIPNWNEYRINKNNSTLEVRNLFLTTTFTTIANNIADLYIDYVLKDGTFQNTNAKTQTLKDGTTNDLTTSNGWNNIIGVRIALLTRAPTPDYSQGSICKTSPTNEKSVTRPASPSLQPSFLDNDGDLINPFVLDTTITTNAYCYRYKIHESVIMMRNMTWRP